MGAVLCSLLLGCVTPDLPPVNTAAPGWQVRQGQAVWQPRPRAPELAGELLLATNRVGDFVLHFAKPPLDLVVAQRTDSRWRIEFPPEQRRFGGHGRATPRLLWLHLPDALAGRELPSSVRFERDESGSWRLANPKTGETLGGFLSP